MTIQEMIQSGRFIWMAHRGDIANHPENTLSAFRGAIESNADMIELDVRLTQDHQLLIMHDADLQRTTNGHGLVFEHRLSDIQSLDAGAWFAPHFAGTRVTTLDEVLEQFPLARFNIELKTSPTSQANTLVSRVLECVHRYDAVHRVMLSSFDHVALHQARQRDRDISMAVIYFGRLLNPFQLAEELGLVSFNPNLENLDLAFVQEAKTRGYGVFAWTVKNRESLDFCLSHGVTGAAIDDLSLRSPEILPVS